MTTSKGLADDATVWHVVAVLAVRVSHLLASRSLVSKQHSHVNVAGARRCRRGADAETEGSRGAAALAKRGCTTMTHLGSGDGIQ